MNFKNLSTALSFSGAFKKYKKTMGISINSTDAFILLLINENSQDFGCTVALLNEALKKSAHTRSRNYLTKILLLFQREGLINVELVKPKRFRLTISAFNLLYDLEKAMVKK